MTITVNDAQAGEVSAAAPSPTESPTPPNRRRPSRDQLVIGALVTVAIILITLGTLSARGASEDLDPDSAAPDGARAVTEVLRTHGVPVQVRRSVAELRPQDAGTVVVTESTIVPVATLRALADSTADLVLITPDPAALELLRVSGLTAGAQDEGQIRDPGCSEPLAQVGSVAAGGRQYVAIPVSTNDPGGSVAVCFGDSPNSGSWAVVQQAQRRVVVIGQPEILRNRSLASRGNAALALRSLGHAGPVQWYVPNPADLAEEGSPTLGELLPPQLPFLVAALLLPIAAVMFWRGRRFGPLVPEPLPVVVRASETAEGRARLYRRARARDRVAATLRTATARRLAVQLNVTELTPAGLVDRLADVTGRQPADITAVLFGPVPQDDAALIRLANSLDDLETTLTPTPRGTITTPTATPLSTRTDS